jgi:CopG family nickel-responsive transcriptional regulator
MEVILLQGPAKTIQEIADEMITRRGVISGKMQLIAALIPQVHPFSRDDQTADEACAKQTGDDDP